MRATHTSKQEIVKTVFDKHGANKALDAGQRILKLKKSTLTNWFTKWGYTSNDRRKTKGPRNTSRR